MAWSPTNTPFQGKAAGSQGVGGRPYRRSTKGREKRRGRGGPGGRAVQGNEFSLMPLLLGVRQIFTAFV